MADQKKQFVAELWKQFIQKITQEWDEKYKRDFGEISDFKQIDQPFNFAAAVRSDVIKHFKQKGNQTFEIVSNHTFNQIFQRGGISENAKFKSLEMLASYIGYKDWDDFTQSNFQNFLNINEDDYGLNKNSSKSSVQNEEQYFIYYYIDTAFKPDKSLLVISKNNAELITFQTDPQGKKHPNVTYEGEITNNKADEITIYFTKERRDDKDYPSANPSFCCFENTVDDKRLGVFAATGKTISCGIVVIEKTLKDEYIDKINDPQLPPAIHSIIHNARLFPTGYYHKNDFLEKKTRIIDTIKKYAGMYEGFSIISQGALSIQKFALEIFENGDVRLKSNGRPEGEFGRIIDVRKGRNLVMQFSLNKVHNYYKIQIILDLQNNRIKSEAKGITKPLIGIYGGIEETSESPMAGRVILYPTGRKFEEMQVELVAIDDEQKVRQLFDEKKPRGRILRKFFRGELDEFVDPPIVLEKCEALSSLATKVKVDHSPPPETSSETSPA